MKVGTISDEYKQCYSIFASEFLSVLIDSPLDDELLELDNFRPNFPKDNSILKAFTVEKTKESGKRKKDSKKKNEKEKNKKQRKR